MKKTISINLGGIAFIIDEDAYQKLEQYINAIKSKFQDQNEQNEIIQDIEFRIAELFTKNLKSSSKEIINIDDVTETTKKLGDPSTIAGEDGDSKKDSGYTNFNNSEKKLFRNPDDKIVSGVCSGLSVYLGLHDPIWIRIFFALIGFITGGGAVIAYIVAIIIIPEAKTSSQKLQMQGRPVTLQNIEESMNNVRDTLNNSGISDNIHSVLRGLTTIVKYIVAGSLLLIGFVLISGLLIGAFQSNLDWLNLGNGFSNMKSFIVDDLNLYILTLAAVFISFGVPAFGMIMLAVRILTRKSFLNGTARLILIGLWILGLFLMGYVIKKWINQVSSVGIYEEKIKLNNTTKTYKLTSNEDLSYELENQYITVNGQQMKEGKLAIPNTELDIKKSSTAEMYLLKIQKSNGKSDAAAYELARSIEANLKINDSSIFIDRLYQIKGDKPIFRNQRLRYVLYMPVGSRVFLSTSSKDLISDIKNKHNMYDDKMVGHTWEMKEEGLECIDCTEDEKLNDNAVNYNSDGEYVTSKKSSKISVNIGGDEGDEFVFKNGKLILKENEKIVKVVDLD
jgi:phage shock protein PspC (stress-responsive transcriptional regulator)